MKCKSDAFGASLQRCLADGLTFAWKGTGETREKARWFNRGTKIQEKQLKIAWCPDLGPLEVYRWKTIEVKS